MPDLGNGMIWPPQRPEFSPAEEARAEAEQEERELTDDELEDAIATDPKWQRQIEQDVAGAEDNAGVYSDADPGL